MSQEAATEALMGLSRTMTAVVARTLGAFDAVTVPQLRVLVLVATHGPMNLKALAENLGVNASNASRTCEKLVSAGLLERLRHPQVDRRNVTLSLTADGETLLGSLVEARRAILGAIVGQMSAPDRELLIDALRALDEAAAAVPEADADAPHDRRVIQWLL
jgi:DNA-binding MarR family transcriptional regulator